MRGCVRSVSFRIPAHKVGGAARWLRAETGLTRAQIARHLGISDLALSDHLNVKGFSENPVSSGWVSRDHLEYILSDPDSLDVADFDSPLVRLGTAGRSGPDFLITYVDVARVFYLQYNRNAWNSTWIGRYYPDTVSFSAESLKKVAERRRVQGSVFSIRELPCLLMSGSRSSLIVLSVLNQHRPFNNDALSGPTFAHNLMAKFSHGEASPILCMEAPCRLRSKDEGSTDALILMQSRATGTKSSLGWSISRTPFSAYDAYIEAREKISSALELSSDLWATIKAHAPNDASPTERVKRAGGIFSALL